LSPQMSILNHVASDMWCKIGTFSESSSVMRVVYLSQKCSLFDREHQAFLSVAIETFWWKPEFVKRRSHLFDQLRTCCVVPMNMTGHGSSRAILAQPAVSAEQLKVQKSITHNSRNSRFKIRRVYWHWELSPCSRATRTTHCPAPTSRGRLEFCGRSAQFIQSPSISQSSFNSPSITFTFHWLSFEDFWQLQIHCQYYVHGI
jgi:hypothetical protein